MIAGHITNSFGTGMENVAVFYSETAFVLTDEQGLWTLTTEQTITIEPHDTRYVFSPQRVDVSNGSQSIDFVVRPEFNLTDTQVLSWIEQQQLANGILESAENSNVVSLYDNALAALTFMLADDFFSAEAIFDFFDARIDSELLQGVGGFSQFRDRNGTPSNHRWMGDNAWLLIALNNYRAATGSDRYERMAEELTNWIISLQATDGGLLAGYRGDDSVMDFKVTEGNIDAFNAIDGYTRFHESLLNFLAEQRWDASDGNLIASPDDPNYRYAVDSHSWAYSLFNDYPVNSLHTADRFIVTHTATATGNNITGYDIDEDRDTVFLEGTGQMALAFDLAGLDSEASFYLNEMEKVLIQSSIHTNAVGFPYSSNRGTGFGTGLLWEGVDTNIALSGGAWYLFAKAGFNPFAVGKKDAVPPSDQFWRD